MIDEQNQYRKQFTKIQKMKIPKILKIQMFNSLKQVLRQSLQIKNVSKNSQKKYSKKAQNKHNKRLKTENQSTKFSLSQSMSLDTMIITNQRDIQQLEENILHKKIFKIQNYEQIEALQQELYRTQDVIQSKRKHNDFLRKKIDQKMVDIQLENQIYETKNQTKNNSLFETPQRSKSQRKQTKSLNKSFSDYIKSFWW